MEKRIKNKSDFIVFFVFFASGFIAYRNTFGIYIPSDNYGAFYLFDKNGRDALKEYFLSTEPFLVSTPVFYFLYKLFGMSSFCWVGLSVLLHVINSFLVYLICSCLQKLFLSVDNKLLSFFSGLLFLLSPYQTEAVVWVPTDFIMMMSVFFLLPGCYFLFQYFNYEKMSHLFLMHLFFLLAIFSFESSFFFPGIGLLAFFFLYKKNKNKIAFKHFALKILLPQAGFIFIYFLLCKVWYGHWIWHGRELDISISPFIYAGNLLKYFVKFFLFYRYLNLGDVDVLLRQCYSAPFFITTAFVALTAAAALLIYFIRNKKETVLLLFLFFCIILSLIPVLPLDSSFLKYIYPDRYGYLPSVFVYMFMSGCIFFIFRKFALPVFLCTTMLFWLLLSQTITVWTDVNNYCSRVIQNYQPFLTYDHVYVLNIPCYYKGIAAFRADFSQSIYFHYNDKSSENIRVIAGSYLETPADSLHSVLIKEDRVEVAGPQKKNPFFSYYGRWAYSYERRDYVVDFDSSGCSYTLRFKNGIPKNSAFIYTSNGLWKKAD